MHQSTYLQVVCSPMFNDFCVFLFCIFLFMLKSDMSKLSMLISIVPSIRSRRAVSNGGPHLSVAYDLNCFVKNLKHGLNMVNLCFLRRFCQEMYIYIWQCIFCLMQINASGRKSPPKIWKHLKKLKNIFQKMSFLRSFLQEMYIFD